VGGQDGHENYPCSFERNPTQHGDKQVDAASIAGRGRRTRKWRPRVKGFVMHRNGTFDNWRFADVSLDN
jgi:hypothetical protein